MLLEEALEATPGAISPLVVGTYLYVGPESKVQELCEC